MALPSLLQMLRPQQWYKNLLIFIPLIFSGELLHADLFLLTLFGFVILCLVSSLSYIINDILDADADRKHAEKRKRALASGRITLPQAMVFWVAILLVTLLMLLYAPILFTACAAALFSLTLIYSLWLKHIPLVDINIVATNFVIRAVSGALLLGLPVSRWLVACVFLLALFWAIGKRDAEMTRLGRLAQEHKRVYAFYTRELLRAITNITCSLLLMSYVLYTFLEVKRLSMMLTIPIAMFMVFRYLYFVYTGSEVAQKSERVFLDPQMVVAGALWLLISIYVFYGNLVL